MLADRLDPGGVGEERAHHGLAAFGVEAEIVKGIGVASLDDRIGLGTQFGHTVSLAGSDRIRSRPVKGMRSHAGRWARVANRAASRGSRSEMPPSRGCAIPSPRP